MPRRESLRRSAESRGAQAPHSIAKAVAAVSLVASAGATIYGYFKGNPRATVLAFLGMIFAMGLLAFVSKAARELGKKKAAYYEMLTKVFATFIVVYCMALTGALFPDVIIWLRNAFVQEEPPKSKFQDAPQAQMSNSSNLAMGRVGGTAASTVATQSLPPLVTSKTVLPEVSIVIGQVDDRIRISLNGHQLHEGGGTNIAIRRSDLKDGDNDLNVDLFNNATRTGGLAMFGGAQKEGWSYSLILTVGQNQFPYSGSHGNDPPDSQWGQWFPVRRIILGVHRELATISVREK